MEADRDQDMLMEAADLAREFRDPDYWTLCTDCAGAGCEECDEGWLEI
jgi:hypothetical protein